MPEIPCAELEATKPPFAIIIADRSTGIIMTPDAARWEDSVSRASTFDTREAAVEFANEVLRFNPLVEANLYRDGSHHLEVLVSERFEEALGHRREAARFERTRWSSVNLGRARLFGPWPPPRVG